MTVTTVLHVLDEIVGAVDVLTEGGPANSSSNLLYFVWERAFLFFQFGDANAAAVTAIVLVGLITWIQFKGFERICSLPLTPQPEAKGRLAGFYLLHGALIILVILNLFPLVWMVATAFTPNSEVFEKAIRFLPDNPTLENFRLAFEAYPVASWFWNSFIISLAVAVGKLALATPAAFAFAHMRFKGRDLLFALVVGTMTVPYVVTIVPVYMGVARVGLFNTAAGVIIPSMAFCGFAVFFLRQNFLHAPGRVVRRGGYRRGRPLPEAIPHRFAQHYAGPGLDRGAQFSRGLEYLFVGPVGAGGHAQQNLGRGVEVFFGPRGST